MATQIGIFYLVDILISVSVSLFVLLQTKHKLIYFFHCHVAIEYWMRRFKFVGLVLICNLLLLILSRELRHNFSLSTRKIITFIWKNRNAYIFRQSWNWFAMMGIYTSRIFTEWNLHTCLDSLNDINHNNASVNPSRTIRVARTPPTPGIFKINFDESVRSNS